MELTNLQSQLEERGIFIGTYGELMDTGWKEDGEIRDWIVNVSSEILKACDSEPSLVEKLDSKSLLTMAVACHELGLRYFFQMYLSKCAIESMAAQNHSDPIVNIMAHLHHYNGYYLGLINNFEENADEGVFDESFTTGLRLHIDESRSLLEHCREILDFYSDQEANFLLPLFPKKCILMMVRAVRGGFLQVEGSIGKFPLECSQRMAKSLYSCLQELVEPIFMDLSELDEEMYTEMHSLLSYSLLVIRGITELEVPDEFILKEADLACMDDQKFSEFWALRTLHGHLTRLRILSTMEGQDKELEKARVAAFSRLEEASTIQNQFFEVFDMTIRSLADTGKIPDMMMYSRTLSRMPP